MDRSGSSSDRSNLMTIVALPEQDDYVYKVSSEKVPHMTLLFLGDTRPDDLEGITQYVGHAASMLGSFGMSVAKRGVLGPQEADVLFFEKSHNYEKLMNFRSHLLANESIYAAYHSAEQFPEWLPHLTLGYPENPAKPNERDYPISWVGFDRIAFWTEDSDGPTFDLKSHSLEVAMSLADEGAAFLEHYGVRGMKWGRRKKSSAGPPENVVAKTSGTKLEVSGGGNRRAHDDAARAAMSKQIVKKSGTNALSNKDLKDLVERMNLEQQFTKLSPPTGSKKAKQYIAKTLGNIGNQQLNMVLNQAASAQIAAALAKAGKK